jgi:phytoene dehydrogenase-like protein
VVADLRNFTWDSATVKVDWALSGPVPWRDARVSRAGTVHLDCDLEGLSAYGADLANGRVPRHPFVLAGQMTTADPSRSPSGTEAMWAYTHLPQRSAWPPGAVDAHVELVEGVIEAHAPGFRALIRGRAIHGPDEMAAGNPNLHGGAIAGGTAAIHQQLFLRPTPGLGRADTPVQNLFLCSASAHPGGGVHGMPGLNAARAALASARPVTGWLYRRAIGAAHHAVHGGLNRATPTGSARHPPPAV